MFLGRVTGELVSTLKHGALEHRRLLWVERTGPGGAGLGRTTLAVDHAQAGEGDWVLVLDEGNGAAQVLGRPRGPIRTVIVGIVDAVETTTAGGAGGTAPRPDPPLASGDGKAATE